MLKTLGFCVVMGMATMGAAAGLSDAALAKGDAGKPQAKAKADSASNCKTLTGKMVGWGVDSVRGYAEKALDSEISAWEHRGSFTAKTKDRKNDCKIYIEWLDEYECTAQAVVCR
ncbi:MULTISPECIES: hypothetical protein [Rhodomicrobium]|uniref:hypothetical protein n=1 Tax=Rhodomicrobium TaxID=1068 RepID=UPI000F746166|nr:MULTISPECIES: hypothetical protein [Rhodomicrobium]